MGQQISGTLEWSVASVNNTKGCRNNCTYCYARARALRFKQIAGAEDWTTMTTRRVRPTKLYPGTVMFPSTHDIFPENYDECVGTLASLLERGNRVLIVSKPRLAIIEGLVRDLAAYREQVLFRFTIGTLDPVISKTWEPGAPLPHERTSALELAFCRGWKTSVSMEPMLSPGCAVSEFYMLRPLVTDGIWIGKMNKIGERVRGVADANVRVLSDAQSDYHVRRIYDALKHEPKVRWKESIKRVVGLPLETEAGVDR